MHNEMQNDHKETHKKHKEMIYNHRDENIHTKPQKDKKRPQSNSWQCNNTVVLLFLSGCLIPGIGVREGEFVTINDVKHLSLN